MAEIVKLPESEITVDFNEKKNEYSVSDKEYKKFLEGRGISPEILKTIRQADNDLIENSFELLSDKVVSTKRNASIKYGSGDGSMVVTMKGHSVGRNPKTGEATNSFGNVTVRKICKVPKALVESEALTTAKEKIRKALA